METQEAIMGFSQSEKIKSAIIWTSQALELTAALNGPEKEGATRMMKMKIDHIIQEIRLAKNIAGNPYWDDIEKDMENAVVMINSGVAADSVSHLTQALSKVTSIGQRSMAFLKEKGLI
ncbi:MAG: hypothetical protein U5R49_01370 [Deltaproteobacteria bacterium]|nr:hypothetical protein [Deltaproteobacteria bacterium]